jgi:8-oxo-dGTP pyrophosphatase MutT (NUDIX family)
MRKWCASPTNPRKAGHYVFMDAHPWVNVVATTEDDHVVMIEQYRAGLHQITLELAGGIVDPGEDPALAGERELLEETGFAGTLRGIIGRCSANPAIFNNYVHTVLVEGCRPRRDQELDGNEEIAVRLVAWKDIGGLIARGVIHHSLVVAALHHEAIRRAGP